MSAHAPEANVAEGENGVRDAVVSFAVRSLVAMVLLAIATVVVSQAIARHVALDDAQFRSELMARALAPLVGPELRDGDRDARSEVATALRPALSSGMLSHVKIWAEDGTVLWSDDPGLLDRRFRLDAEVTALFGTDDVVAEVSDLSEAENANARSDDKLLEVYVGALDRELQPWVFEAYMPTAAMAHHRKSIVAGVLPLALGGILLLQLTVLPLALSLARRVRRAQTERSKLLRHTLLASELERRRLAQDLHDGVIQDLAGLSLALPVVAGSLPDGPDSARARRAVDQVTAVLERDVPALRDLLTDMYPPDLDGEGLAPVIRDLAVRAEDAGVHVRLQLPADAELPTEARRMAYRVVREGLRNAARHAPGATVEVHVLRSADEVVVRVADDGPGLPPGHRTKEGHLGLRLLADTLRDLGGSLDLSNRAFGGAVLEARFPERLTATE